MTGWRRLGAILFIPAATAAVLGMLFLVAQRQSPATCAAAAVRSHPRERLVVPGREYWSAPGCPAAPGNVSARGG